MLVGYARVSTVGQDIDTQKRALRDLGVPEERTYVDFGFSGRTLSRAGLQQALAAVREGDTFVVPKFDRLARDTEDALSVLRGLTERGVKFQIGPSLHDPSDPMSKLFVTVLAAVAEAEAGWVSLRTRERLADPKVRAKMTGKKPSLSPRTDALIYEHVHERGESPTEVARTFKTSRQSVYRALERHESTLPGTAREGEEQP